MRKIKLMNKIAAVGTNVFDKAVYEVSDSLEGADAIMVRSASLHEMEFDSELLAIARAGAGVNNIPTDKCAERGIVVFNTPGANANGVKELAVAALILASRDVVGGIEWVKANAADENIAKTVEKEKSKFAGCEILGKTLGVLGLGAIGGLVANTAKNLGMKVIGCDPYLTVNAAWSLSSAVVHAQSYDEIYASSDYITLHVPSTPTTRGMINKETIAKMKDGVRIINLARADLVNSEDMKAALESGKVAAYVTDFPTPDTVNMKNTVSIPHLGASTAESEDNCAVMAARQLCEFLETGNIKNSVNFPAVSIPHTGASRICICHKNVANMLASITGIVSGAGINIENLSNGSKGDFAYTIVEMSVKIPADIIPKIEAIEGVIKVRVIE
ncbi:MAG: 3-phosphoglycerate dehydrogenase [Ruminococcaceae bacterium]|nr:3-phosphoglycerate dehydrogenase [Oscillospiraceae bacterium]